MAELVDGGVVETFDVTIEVDIRSFLVDGGWRYDWYGDGGQESDEWHHTIDDAIRDAQDRLGG